LTGGPTPRVSAYVYWDDLGDEREDVGGHGWWFYQRLRSPKPKA
jgi:hypothetical protein